MKVAIYSPYLDTLGGGERYMMTIAEILSQNNQVDILLNAHLYLMDTENLLKKLSERFGLDLSKVNLIKAPVGNSSNSLERALFLTKYDLLIYLTDGSIFYPTATRNILHIQSPIIGQPAKSIFGKLKLSGWDLIIYNSKFTKDNCYKAWSIKSEVVYPPVDIESLKVMAKKKNILSVGRFFNYLKDKKHSILIKAFKNIYKNKKLKGWSLNLVGSAGEADKGYLEELKREAGGLPVNFYPNLEYNKLLELYGESSIYWHAAGFNETDPTKMEHFGISTVEAMAAGCVPIVISKGGQAEIVENNKSGFLWDGLEEMEKFTLKIILDEKTRKKISTEAVKRSQLFSKEKFKEKFLDILND